MNQPNDVLDVFEMTPAQAGMLFQTLYAPDSGAYFQQYWGRLEGILDADAFRAAWQAVIDRHEILRARCHWQDLDRPALAIHRTADPEWRHEDWSGLPDAAQRARLDDWLAADRARGFDPGALPLMRFALIRTGAASHVFVWSFHHLLLDGWCGALLVREMLAIYAGATPGPRPRPFRDYVEWQQRQDGVAARDYWTQLLAGIEGPTPLGIDRAETDDTGVAEHRATLDADLTAAIMEFARRERLTLATVMQGAWALVLSRYAGQPDVTFGTVLSGRPADLAGAEEMIGLFLQTVPLRVVAADVEEILPWLHAIQTAHPRREAHGHIGLSEIRAAAGLPASTPLFDSLLIVETYPESIEAAVSRGDAALRLCDSGMHERTDFPLVLKILPGEAITLCLTADAARIPSFALSRLAGHLAQVLRGMVEGAGTAGEIDLLTGPERDRLAELGQGIDLPEAPSTLARLLHMAAGQPDRAAVETPGGAVLTYAGLMARAGEIAATLHELGVGRGDIVAICQDRTPDLLASLIAVWRCGATYLPLDPAYPADRIAYILEDAQAVLALVDQVGQRALGSLENMGVLDVADCAGTATLPDRAEPDDMAYVLYTSGSTGRPKGVPITHGALSNFLASMCREPGIGPDDRLLALTTVAFDIAGLELFGPLITGGTVVLAETGAALDGAGLARMIEHHRIGIMQATPAGWRVLRDSGWRGAPGLRMISGGEALDSALARDLLSLGGELWNLYGPTETTIWSAALRVGAEHLTGPKVPVGGPIACTTLSLRDAQGRRVPFGVSGELWIGGDGLSPGYLGRPDLTADRFVTRDGARHYRTGDRMRLNENGTLDFLGRFDDQVKLRGYRIELGEIEAQMETHPAVMQAVAMVRGEGSAAKLIGYLRPGSTAPAAAEMRAYLSQILPGYMIPSAWVVLDRFPLTPNGKIDRKALPLPENVGRAAALSAPLTDAPRDQVVAGIWAEVLDLRQVGPGEDFFALGGHSLLAMRVIAETRRHLGIDLTLRDLFEASTLEGFCARIARRTGGPVLPAVTPGASPVLSAAQHRQWLLARLDPGSAAYHLPLAVRLSGRLDVAALRRALSDLARRHTVLCCRFPADQGTARVEILPDAGIDLREDNLSALDAAARDAAIERLRDEEARAPFDMQVAPPWRARLLRLAGDDHVLLLTFHHILADEWSFGVMLGELRAGYLGDDTLPPAVQYADFAAWQRGLSLAAQRDFWCRMLDGAPAVLNLPADRPRPDRREGVAGRVPIRVGPEAVAALEALARANGASLFICLLAAYVTFLHRHSGDRDFLIGTPVSNRRLPEFQGLVGLFVNTLALRADLSGVVDFTDAIARMREVVLAAHAHQDLPFEQVIEALSPPRSESHAPVVQTMFSMPDLPEGGDLGTDLRWSALPGRDGRARFDLSLELGRTEGGLAGHFDYAADIFDAGTAEALARRFEVLLEGLAGAADLPLADLPLLTTPDWALALPVLEHAVLTSPPGVLDGPQSGQANDPDWRGPAELPGAFLREADGRLRPAPGVRAVVLGEGGALTPPGAAGMLALGGAGLARGYAGDPAATAAVFVPNPHVDPRRFDPAESCLFLTGLTARLDRDGLLSLVLPPPEPPRLRAVIAGAAIRSGGDAPVGEIEAMLAAIWADVLGIAAPGRDEGFFDLGGDSVLAVQVASRAADAGLTIEPRDLFRHQTIAELAAVAQPAAMAVLPDLPALDVDMQAIAAMVSFDEE